LPRLKSIKNWQLKTTLLTGFFYFTYYMARYNYSATIPFIQAEFGLNNATIGLMATILTAGYAVGQFINGYLIDRIGPRIMMSLGGLLTWLANLAVSIAGSFQAILIFWGLNGYVQAMGYGSVCKLYSNWFPPEERGKPLGFNEFLQSFSSFIIVPLGAFLIIEYGWRSVYIIPTIPVLIVSFFFFKEIRDKPQDEGYTPHWVTTHAHNTPAHSMVDAYKRTLSDWRMVASYVSYGGSQFARFVIYTWVAKYIYELTGNIIIAGWVTAAFALGGSIGSLAVGWLSDKLRLRWPIITLGMLVSAFSLIIFASAPHASPLILSLLMAICGSGIEAVEVCYFLLPMDILDDEGYQATGVGVMNAFGKAFATIQGVLFGVLLDLGSYETAFLVTAVICIFSALLVMPIRK